jgi:hypothetical protein
MKCKIEFDMDNAAFDDYPASEAGQILYKIAGKMAVGETDGPVTDINGNIIGQWAVEGDRP